jgi:hypothetical protein
LQIDRDRAAASVHLEYSRKSEILFYAIRFESRGFSFDRRP